MYGSIHLYGCPLLKAIAGSLPVGSRSRERTRSDVAKHWESAVKLVAALEEEGAAEHRGNVAVL
ncbi:hypothetical protein FJW08_31055 [Mesorhizobium sp. B3-2-1]|nr:hypothetical protein FJW08_31055 [Mesorhizobium sp. B3-2-1]